jgi:Integrase core domain.
VEPLTVVVSFDIGEQVEARFVATGVACVMDEFGLFSRKVVGWAMRDHLRQELTIAAPTMALQRQRPGRRLIHHSDRGSQYAAGDDRAVLKANGIVPSMSRTGNCWDNAPMESWFHTQQDRGRRRDTASSRWSGYD